MSAQNSLKNELIHELHRPARRNFTRRPVILKGKDDLYQMDLIFLKSYARENGGYKYLLALINAFSKKAYLEPLKSKRGKEVAEALEKILDRIKTPFKLLQSDDGTEFYNSHVSALLKRHNIKLYSSYSTLKSSIVERFLRTYKSWLYEEFSKNGNHRWTKIYDDVLRRYNSKVHRTIGVAPNKVNKKNEKNILARFNNRILPPKKKARFKKDEAVRISKYKKVFDKSYHFNWTPEIFYVHRVEPTRPVTYTLRDYQGEKIDGKFYSEELSKVKDPDIFLVERVLKRKPGMVYVKWYGFDNSHNEWIKSEDMV